MRSTTFEPKQSNERGFTLVEVMISLSIFVAVMALIFAQLSNSVAQTASIDQATVANSTARLAMDVMTRELRQASTGDETLSPVETISATGLTFYTPDRQEPVHLRKISYRVVAGALERSEVTSTNSGTAPWSFPVTTASFVPVFRGVTNTNVFSYEADFGVPAITAGSVKVVRLNFELKSGVTKPAVVVFTTDVNIRSHE